jgi:hypothetical protein
MSISPDAKSRRRVFCAVVAREGGQPGIPETAVIDRGAAATWIVRSVSAKAAPGQELTRPPKLQRGRQSGRRHQWHDPVNRARESLVNARSRDAEPQPRVPIRASHLCNTAHLKGASPCRGFEGPT